MKKIKYAYLIIILFISSCSSNNFPGNSSLFILGGWYGEFEQLDGTKSYKVQNEFYFLPFNILINTIKMPDERKLINLFSYKFAKDNRVLIKGRLVDEFQFARDGDDLVIDSVRGFPSDGRYTRVCSIWDWIITISIICVVLILLLIKTRRRKQPNNYRLAQ